MVVMTDDRIGSWIDNNCQDGQDGVEGGIAHGDHEHRSAGLDEAVRAGTRQPGWVQQCQRIRELIRADQKRRAEERIDALLLEGLDSGTPIPVTQEYWDEKKRRLTERLSRASSPSMTSHYRVLPAADCDLDEYAAYLESQAGLDTALRFYDAAASTFSRIAGMPGIGERWTSSNPRLADLRVRRIEGFENSLFSTGPAMRASTSSASSTGHATSIEP